MKSAKIQTYLEQIRSGKIKTDRDRIFNYIRNNPGNIERTISKQLGIPLQTVSARCSDLKDFGIVKSLSQTKTNNSTHEVLHPVEDIIEIAKSQQYRKKTKWENWLKKAEQFSEFMDPDFISQIKIARSNAV